MLNWLKKRIFKSIIKDVIKKMPKYKNIAFEHLENVVNKIVENLENIIDNELAKVLNK
jgi:hypothetical protein